MAFKAWGNLGEDLWVGGGGGGARMGVRRAAWVMGGDMAAHEQMVRGR